MKTEIMSKKRVLVTGVGAPGIKGTIYSLRNNFDNESMEVIGTDIKEDVVGTYLCDKFYRIHHPSSHKYIDDLLDICKTNKVNVVLPQNTKELCVLASNKNLFEEIGTTIAISDSDSIKLANNKFKLMQTVKSIPLPTVKFDIVTDFSDLHSKAVDLGWPERPVVVKPPDSNGSRGVRIIDEKADSKARFYSEKPSSLITNMEYLSIVLGETFPELIVMEYLPGEEYTVDLLRTDELIIIPRRRDLVRSGITFNGTIQKNEEIIEFSRKLTDYTKLKFAFGYQFKLSSDNTPILIESNPRIQGTMVLSTLAGVNMIYASVKHAMGEELPKFKIKWGVKMLRYWGGVGIIEEDTLLI